MMEIGFCGTGRMGAAMVQRLMDQGHRLAVWNRSADKTKPLLERGARAAKTPAEAAAGREIVITMLTDARAVDAVYDGPQGLLSGDVKGKLFIDMSTVTPETTKKLASRVRAKGAPLVDCPVGGTIGPPRDGKLLGLAGGDPAAFPRPTPFLPHVCPRRAPLAPHRPPSAL